MGFDIHGIDGLMKELGALEVERVAPAMLKESVPILEKSVKKHAVKHEDTGDLIESVKKTGAQRNRLLHLRQTYGKGPQRRAKHGKNGCFGIWSRRKAACNAGPYSGSKGGGSSGVDENAGSV